MCSTCDASLATRVESFADLIHGPLMLRGRLSSIWPASEDVLGLNIAQIFQSFLHNSNPGVVE